MGHNVDLKSEIAAWRKRVGLDLLEPLSTGELEWALNISQELHDLPIQKVGACMLILSNHLCMLAAQMGMIFSRVRYLEMNAPRDDAQLLLQRTMLNQIKPIHDAVRDKIAVVKKIYDHKSREVRDVSGSGR